MPAKPNKTTTMSDTTKRTISISLSESEYRTLRCALRSSSEDSTRRGDILEAHSKDWCDPGAAAPTINAHRTNAANAKTVMAEVVRAWESNAAPGHESAQG